MPLNARLQYSQTLTLALNEKQIAVRDQILDRYLSGEIETESVPCYCGDDGGQEIALKDRYGFPIRTVLCMRCGLLRTSPRMKLSSARRFYAESYRVLYDGGDEKPDDRFATDLHTGQKMIQSVPRLMSMVETVFDVGCASGGILKAFQNAGKQTAGCDMNRTYLEYGRQQGLHLIEGEVATLAAEYEKQADLVLLSHVLEHFFDLKSEFEAVVDAARPGGFIIVIVPGLATVASTYRSDLLLYFQNAHNYHFGAPTLRYVLESTGVEVMTVDADGVALVRRPENWERGRFHETTPPPSAGLENLSLLLRFESALQVTAGKDLSNRLQVSAHRAE